MNGECWNCKKYTNLEEHHIFGGVANRPKSEKYGLKVMLCQSCHRTGKEAAHGSGELSINLRQRLHEYGERKFLEDTNGTIEDFIKVFGKNYI